MHKFRNESPCGAMASFQDAKKSMRVELNDSSTKLAPIITGTPTRLRYNTIASPEPQMFEELLKRSRDRSKQRSNIDRTISKS